jgi:hypothetical protein
MKANLLNPMLRRVIPVGMCAGLACCFLHAQDKPVESQSKPKAERPAKPSPVKVPFLGLALGQVDESLVSQLNLPEGTGVLVLAVLPDSPAAKAGILKHDVLHHFNDQLLVNEPQLQTLVRQAGIGADVTLKLLRKGREETVIVKLGEHEELAPAAPWLAREYGMHRPNSSGYGAPPSDGRLFNIPLNGDGFANRVRELSERMKKLEGKPDEMREEVERFQKEIQEQTGRAAGAADQERAARQRAKTDREDGAAPPHASSKVWKDDKGGIHVEVRTNDGRAETGGSGIVTATADDKGTVTVTQTNNTRLTWNDGDGSGELQIENGKKKLTARDRDGKEIFSGPIDTEDQLKSLPAGLRERLERLESKVKVEVRAGKPAGDL